MQGAKGIASSLAFRMQRTALARCEDDLSTVALTIEAISGARRCVKVTR